MDKLRADVIKELTMMKHCGIRVPAKAFKLAETEDLSEYDNMSVSEIAELLIDLSAI